jgi:hypothetical protein
MSGSVWVPASTSPTDNIVVDGQVEFETVGPVGDLEQIGAGAKAA